MDLDPLATVKEEKDEDLECESVAADESECEVPAPELDGLLVSEQDPVFQPLTFVAVKEEPHDEMKRTAHPLHYQRNYGGGNICSFKECTNSTHNTRDSEPPVNFFRYPIRDIKRKTRVAPEQMSSMVAFMEKHPALALGSLVGPHRRFKSEQLWKKLALQLNTSRKGPSKDTSKWQKTWADWKSTIKAKASKIRARANSTSPTEQVLTPLENRLLSILSREAAAGEASAASRSLSPALGDPTASRGISRQAAQRVSQRNECSSHTTEQSTSVLPQPVDRAEKTDTSCTSDAMTRDSYRLDADGDSERLKIENEKLQIKKERLEIEKERLQVKKEKLQLERERFEKEKDYQKQMEILAAGLLAYFKNS